MSVLGFFNSLLDKYVRVSDTERLPVSVVSSKAPLTTSVTNAGSSSWIKLSNKLSPFNVGFGCVVTSGTPTYTVEHTFDDPDGSPVAFPHAFVVAATENKDGNYAFPVRGIRVTITEGTGAVALTAIEAGYGVE